MASIIPFTVFLLSLASASALPAATTSASSDGSFYWSIKDTTNTTAYGPTLDLCGTGSCGDCDPKAQLCPGDEYHTVCFVPDDGDRCCNDLFGTSCYSGFYCAYDSTSIAYCCEAGKSLDDCSKVLNIDLQSMSRSTTTQPTSTASRPFTSIPSSSTVKTTPATVSTAPTNTPNPSTSASNTPTSTPSAAGLSSGAKAGVGVGVTLGALGALAAGAFFFLRRRNKKWEQVAQHTFDSDLPEMISTSTPKPPPPNSDTNSSYDPCVAASTLSRNPSSVAQHSSAASSQLGDTPMLSAMSTDKSPTTAFLSPYGAVVPGQEGHNIGKESHMSPVPEEKASVELPDRNLDAHEMPAQSSRDV